MIPSDHVTPRENSMARAASLALAGALGFGLGVWATRPRRRVVENRAGFRDPLERFAPEQSQAFMRRAIANARKAGVEERTGGPFGAVVVDRRGEIIGEGSNRVVANHDPSWHAEMEAIRNACAAIQSRTLEGCVLFASSEPCPMCLAAAHWARLDGIVFASTVDDAATYGGFDDAFLYEQFTRPAPARQFPISTILRDEAVEVWREYAAQPDNPSY